MDVSRILKWGLMGKGTEYLNVEYLKRNLAKKLNLKIKLEWYPISVSLLELIRDGVAWCCERCHSHCSAPLISMLIPVPLPQSVHFLGLNAPISPLRINYLFKDILIDQSYFTNYINIVHIIFFDI